MKKYMLMLALALIASPALAGVTISVVDNGDCTANIDYAVVGEANAVAAFALDISVDAGTITGVTDFHTGVSVEGSAGYGIFPANFDREITVNTDGTVNGDQWVLPGYTPVADGNDKGAAGALGTAAITVELGALYKGEANAPADTGTLCTIALSESATVSLAGNAIRGEVVLEGAGEPTGVTYNGGAVSCGPPICMPTDDPSYTDWVALGSPECWCLTTHCYGDADGLAEVSKTGAFRVHFNDIAVLLLGWDVMESPAGPGIATITGAGGLEGACADFDHAGETSKTGTFRVHFNDIAALIASWNIMEPPAGPGLGTDCTPGTIEPQAL
jgi:hypothetical protein